MNFLRELHTRSNRIGVSHSWSTSWSCVLKRTKGQFIVHHEKLIEFAGKKVEASGDVVEKDGKRQIALASIKVAQ